MCAVSYYYGPYCVIVFFLCPAPQACWSMPLCPAGSCTVRSGWWSRSGRCGWITHRWAGDLTGIRTLSVTHTHLPLPLHFLHSSSSVLLLNPGLQGPLRLRKPPLMLMPCAPPLMLMLCAPHAPPQVPAGVCSACPVQQLPAPRDRLPAGPGASRAAGGDGLLQQVGAVFAFRWRFWKFQTYSEASWMLKKTENAGMSA